MAITVKPGDVGLKREIGLIGATWASETSIIGSGWLFGSYLAASYVGGAAVIDWVIAGVIIIILALIHAELGGMYPVAGGTARFPHLAFGGIAGTSFGFFSWLQAVTVAPIECFAVIQYLAVYSWSKGLYNSTTGNITHWGFFWTIVIMAAMTGFNFLAMKLFNRVQSTITWWKVIIPVATIIILFTKFHGSNFTAGGGFMPKGVTTKDLLEAIPGASIVFSYLGFEQADQLAGEVKNPQRTLPLAIIISITLGTIIYCLLQVVFIGAVPASLLGHGGFAGIPSSNNIAIAPFWGVAVASGLGVWAWFLRVDAFISPFGTGMVYETSTSRVGYGLSRNHYFPSMFQKVDKNGVPWFSLIMAFIFGLVFLLPFPSWHSLVNLVTSASVLMYAGAPLALGAFRNRLPDAPRPYRLPGAIVMAPLAFILANLVIYWSGFETVWKLGVCLVIGYILILMHFSDNPTAPRLEWKRSSWIFAYLLGMGVISWMGQYGPQNTDRIPFGIDFAVVAVWSLVIYYWAQNSALPVNEIEELIEAQAAPEPEETAEPAAA
jgi:amino acid transporter